MTINNYEVSDEDKLRKPDKNNVYMMIKRLLKSTKNKNLNLFTYLLIGLGFALFTVGAVAGIKYCYDYFKEKTEVTDDTDIDENVTLVDGEIAEQGVSYDMPNNITFSKLSTTSTSSSSDSSTVTITPSTDTLSCDVACTYNDVTIQSLNETFKFSIGDLSSLLTVTSLSVDNTSIVF